jgi:casein kinase I family protein HRR25
MSMKLVVSGYTESRNVDLMYRACPLSSLRPWRHQTRQFFDGRRRSCLAKQYRDPKTHLHIPYKENCPPTGTAPYVSINNHKGVEQSRRDDLESLAYILVYFLHGSLPWYGVEPAVNKQRHNAILRRKQSSHLTRLCSACPPEFGMFLNYARTLAFDEKPDYGYLRKLFRELLMREGHQYGHPFPDGIISINPHVGTRAMTNR